MSDEKQNSVGKVGWVDLTVPDADKIRDFYKEVIGWTSEGLDMQDGDENYQDYVMSNESGEGVAGICHLRGANADLPPMWLMYVPVADVHASVEKCLALGGEVLKRQLREDGSLYYAIIKDPAGAVMALTSTG